MSVSVDKLKFLIEKNNEIYDEKKKFKYNIKNIQGNTPLFNVIIKGRLDFLEVLLNLKDVNVYCRNNNDMNIFHIAAYHSKYEIIEHLSKNYRTKNLVNEKTKDGCFPLYFAKDIKVISMLINLGKKLNKC
jgi:ankyrin repeat protein